MKAAKVPKGPMTPYIVSAFAFLMVVGSLFVYYFMSGSQKFTNEPFELSTAPSSTNNDLQVYLFYATWCHYCEKYLQSGKFDTFPSAVASANVGGSVAFQQIDVDQNPQLTEKYGINSFPTIVAVDKQGNVFRFRGNRDTSQDMIKFVTAALQKRDLSERDYSN